MVSLALKMLFILLITDRKVCKGDQGVAWNKTALLVKFHTVICGYPYSRAIKDWIHVFRCCVVANFRLTSMASEET